MQLRCCTSFSKSSQTSLHSVPRTEIYWSAAEPLADVREALGFCGTLVEKNTGLKCTSADKLSSFINQLLRHVIVTYELLESNEMQNSLTDVKPRQNTQQDDRYWKVDIESVRYERYHVHVPHKLQSHSTSRTTFQTVIPQCKICGCDWSKSRHVTFTKTRWWPAGQKSMQ